MASNSPSNLYPITIIGAGITGLSTAYHLHKLGVGPVRLYFDPTRQASSKNIPAYVTGGCWDNFTRISHAKGVESAAKFWGFGDRAFDELKTFCMQHKLPWSQGPRLRLICSEEELHEAAIALKQLQSQGFGGARFWSKKEAAGFGSRVLEIQEDGHRASVTDAAEILNFLLQFIKAEGTLLSGSRVLSLGESSDGINIHPQGNQSDQTQMLVLACHYDLGRLLPDLKEAVIPVADQWSFFSINNKQLPSSLQRKTAFISAHHAYEWGLVQRGGSLVGGGCRYLRKHAGIGEANAPFEPRIETKNGQQFTSWFEHAAVKIAKPGSSSSDIYPCDETPLIGPMFGTDRILLATGFMHLGLSYGFFAGKCLAELIHSGECDSLPRIFWPERLRSL